MNARCAKRNKLRRNGFRKITKEEIAVASWPDCKMSWIFCMRECRFTQLVTYNWSRSDEPGVIEQKVIKVFFSPLQHGSSAWCCCSDE